MNRHKLNEWKAGPFKKTWVGKRACTLAGIPEGYHDTFHVSLLEPYHRGPTAPPQIQLPPLEEKQGHYEPEAILQHGLDDNDRTKFLVSWKGYPLSESTWEPFESLFPGSERLLSQFYANNPEIIPDPRWKPEQQLSRQMGQRRKRKQGESSREGNKKQRKG